MQDRAKMIRERLAPLQPIQLDIIDESHLHAGHAGAKGGASHFRLVIRSKKFEGLTSVARQRLVYNQLQDLIPFPIHALSISAQW